VDRVDVVHLDRDTGRGGIVVADDGLSAALVSMSDSDAARTVERLRETLVAHQSDDHGVTLDSRAWLITARRR
jgi:hypothetical protein